MLAKTSQGQHSSTIPSLWPLKPGQRSHGSLSEEAIRLLSSIGPPPPLTPPRMGLLVAGLHLVCCWRYLGALVEGFDSRGLNVLWQMWATAVAAVFLGQLVKYFAPAQHGSSADEDFDLVMPEHTLLQHSSKLLPLKEGQELGLPLGKAVAAAAAGAVGGHHEQHQQRQEEEDEDDITVIKRRAQEEAAAKLAKYRAEVQQLLASIRKEASGSGSSSSSTPVDAQLLYRLADQLFASSINVSEFVELDGVPVVVEAMRANTRCLAAALPPQQRQQQQQEIEEERQPQQEERQPQQESMQAAALSSMLQASWVLLQLSQGPPACKAVLQEPQCSGALLAAAQTVSALPPAAGHATEAILRNIWWALLTLTDKPARGLRSNSSSSQRGAAAGVQQQLLQDKGSAFWQQLLGQFQQYGAVPMLQQLVSLRHGLSAGWVAAAHLGLLMQLGHHQQQQPQSPVAVQSAGNSELQALAAAAAQAVLQEDSVVGLCYLMVHLRLEQPPAARDQQHQAHRPHLSGRMRVLVDGMLHFLLAFHGPQLLQQLLELQLLGCFAAHSSPRLARLLVCQLLSSKGQEVMAAVEQGYELDVALGLAQIIPLKVHVRVPAPAQQQQQPAGGEIEPAGEAATAAAQQQEQQHRPQPLADDLYTDILACRLLLQRERLGELLSAFCEELQAPADPEQQARQQMSAGDPVAAAADTVARECSVVAASCALINHLMSRDLQLQAAKHVRGDCVSDTFSGTTSSSSRSLDEALAMPDHSGVYSQVMAGMVPAARLPAAAAATSSSSTPSPGLTLPAAQQPAAGQQAAAAGRGAAGGQVVFQFGEQQHALDAATFKQLRSCSKLVSSVLGRARCQGGPVTVLAVPQFTDEANCWVLQCLERWLTTSSLDGFSVLQAAKLWVAADFLQVDELQVACEDLVARGLKADPQAHVPVALELCARHPDSGGRLLRLLVQQLLRALSRAVAQDSAAQLQHLRQALAQHTSLLLPVMQAELRDRLVTLCMLNAGQDAEDPLDVVG